MAVFRLIADNFNNLLGSNVTHVANAYHQTIWVVFTSEEVHLPELDVELKKLSVKVKKGDNLRDLLDALFGARRSRQTVRIISGEFHKQQRNNATDYLTIFIKDANDKIEQLFENQAIRANRSYIVKPNGQAVMSKYEILGDSDIWQDEYGTDYRPK